MIAYLSVKDLCDVGTATTYNSYSDLIESISPKLKWNGYYFEVRVLSEDELTEIAQKPAPDGCSRMSRDRQDLYNLNVIRDYVREKINPEWKKVKFVVGMHRERNYSNHVPPPHFWTEVFWVVEGVTYVI